MDLNLKEFVRNFVCKNTLIKLWVEIKGGHQLIHKEGSICCMEHELLNNKVWQSKYNECKVIGVTDISCDDFYREAVNIVIEQNN